VDNLICFSLKELNELKVERKKIFAELQAKKWQKGGKSERELALEEKEMKRTSKSVELVNAAMDAKKEKEAADSAAKEAALNDSNKRKSSASTQPAKTDSKKPKISPKSKAVSTPSKAIPSSRSKPAVSTPSKAASTSRAPIVVTNGSVTCHRCGLIGHIALDCAAEKDKSVEEEPLASEATNDSMAVGTVAAASDAAPSEAAPSEAAVVEAEDVKPESASSGVNESVAEVLTESSAEKNGAEASVAEAVVPETEAQKKKTTPIKSTPVKKNSDFICHYCNAPGHKKPYCYKMKDDLAKGITNGGFQPNNALLPRPNEMGDQMRMSPGPNFVPGPPSGPPLGPPLGPPHGPPGPPPGLGGSIMGVPPMQRPGFGPPISGPLPFNPGNMDEKTIVENRLEGLRSARGIRFSWSASECAFLVMMQDHQQRNDQIVKIGSLDQFLQVFGN